MQMDFFGIKAFCRVISPISSVRYGEDRVKEGFLETWG